jgi:hypothetical protein
MNTLTYGRQQPETGDESEGVSGWFAAIEANIALDDAHSHNGTDSVRLDSRSMDAHTTTTGTSWGSTIGDGLYRMSIAMPAGRDFDKYDIAFKDSAGQRVYLEYRKIDASNYYVYTNDNTQNYTVLYIS